MKVSSRKGSQHASSDGEIQQRDGNYKKENNGNARNEEIITWMLSVD